MAGEENILEIYIEVRGRLSACNFLKEIRFAVSFESEEGTVLRSQVERV